MDTGTRVDNSKLKAVDLEKKLTDLISQLKPYLMVLTDEERKNIYKPKEGLPQAALIFNGLMGEYADVAKAASYQTEAMVEDLNNLNLINNAESKLKHLLQMVLDTKLKWMQELHSQMAPAYKLSKALSESNGALANKLKDVEEFFGRKNNAAKPEEPSA